MESTTNLPISSSIICNLDSLIEVESVRIDRQASIPHRVHFHLDSNLLQQITQIRDNNLPLSLPPKILTDLRYYALLNSPLEQIGLVPAKAVKDRGCYSNSLLVFDTNYLNLNSERSLTVLRSVIDPKGKISQHIHQDLWHNPQLLEQISEVHYWLISEILAQLPFEPKGLYSWFIFCLLLIIASFLTLTINYFFSLNWLENSIIFLGVLILFKIQFKEIMAKRIKTWFIHHIVSGLWLKTMQTRKFALHILALMA
ncbi:MAG: hypothetical protein AAF383_20905 [Cyanobacteria bacterium P01_A01_bin.83]